jgi:hypothetical protein
MNLKALRSAQDALVDETFKREFENALNQYQSYSKRIIAFTDKNLSFIEQLGLILDKGGVQTTGRAQEEIETIQRKFLKENSGFFTNYLTNEFRRAAGIDLSKEQADILEKYYNSILTLENINLLSSDKEEDQDAKNKLLESLQRQAKNYLDIAQPIYEEIDKAAETSFNHQLEVYKNLINGLKDGDGLKEALQEDYAALEFFLKVFKDFEEIPDIFEKIGVNVNIINDLSLAADKAGLSINRILQDVARRKQAILEADPLLDPVLAQAQAYSEVASSIGDAEFRARLYNIAMRNTTQEIAQNVDTVTSRLKNINEVQKQILEGKMSASDIFDFTQRNQDVFQDQELFNKFLKGENIELDLINSALEAQAQYRENLLIIEQQILKLKDRKDLDEEQKAQLDSLTAQRNELILLTRYNGELANVTKAQYEYNKVIIQQNK